MYQQATPAQIQSPQEPDPCTHSHEEPLECGCQICQLNSQLLVMLLVGCRMVLKRTWDRKWTEESEGLDERRTDYGGFVSQWKLHVPVRRTYLGSLSEWLGFNAQVSSMHEYCQHFG